MRKHRTRRSNPLANGLAPSAVAASYGASTAERTNTVPPFSARALFALNGATSAHPESVEAEAKQSPVHL
jgi:hypothetical protein